VLDYLNYKGVMCLLEDGLTECSGSIFGNGVLSSER